MKALIIVILVLTLLMLIPLGVDGGYNGKNLILGLRVGFLNICVFPRKKKPTKPPKTKKQKRAKKKETELAEEETEKKKKAIDKEKIKALIKAGLKAMGRFRKKLNIDYIRLRYVIATDDPFKTAMAYGTAGATLSVVLPLFENAFSIDQREIGASVDFIADKPYIDFWITATIHVWEIFYIGIAFGIDWLKMKRRQKRKEEN